MRACAGHPISFARGLFLVAACGGCASVFAAAPASSFAAVVARGVAFPVHGTTGGDGRSGRSQGASVFWCCSSTLPSTPGRVLVVCTACLVDGLFFGRLVAESRPEVIDHDEGIRLGLDLPGIGDGLQPSVLLPCADTSVLGILLLCARTVRSRHPRPPVVTAPVYRGCPARTHWGDDSSMVMRHQSANSVLAVLVLSCW